MENTNNSNFTPKLSTIALATLLAFSPMTFATENDQKVEKELEEVEKSEKKKLDKKEPSKRERRSRYKKVTLSQDKSYYTIDGKEELGPNPVDGEELYVKYDRKKYEDDYEDEDDHEHYRFRKLNERDGFYLAYSAVSSSGDDFYSSDEDSEAAFDTHFSYRVQLLGFFVESPGLNSRRIHGLYASNAWGFNFYNSDNWSFDIYKQTNTKKVEGLREVQNRNRSKRAGLRATGYFDNSQLQFIYSPESRGDSEENGIEASISYTHYWQVKNWNIYGSLGAQYQSEEIVDHYLPDTSADQSRINTSAELGVEYALNEDWVLGGFASYNEVSSQNSLNDESTDGTRAGILLTFLF